MVPARPRPALGDQAQALVEFALVLPLLLVFAFALFQVAELGIARLALEHAAAEGARTGALTNDDEAIRETVAATAVPLDPAAVEVAIEPPGDGPPRAADPRGSLLSVRLRYALPLRVALLPRLVVETVATRRIEWTP